ncbi:MAG: hypothetical protein ACK58T_43660, partial [Phycisphaerae bacterium]
RQKLVDSDGSFSFPDFLISGLSDDLSDNDALADEGARSGYHLPRSQHEAYLIPRQDNFRFVGFSGGKEANTQVPLTRPSHSTEQLLHFTVF